MPTILLYFIYTLSLELNFSDCGCKIQTEWITDLFYIDELKLYTKDDSEREGLLRIVKEFSDDMWCAARFWYQVYNLYNVYYRCCSRFLNCKNRATGTKSRKAPHIGMEVWLIKYVSATFRRGKLEKSNHVQLDEETIIKDLEQEKVYQYLGVGESSGIQIAKSK